MPETKGKMTNRQRIEALINRQRPDRVPVWIWNWQGFAALHSGITLADAYTKPQAAYAAQRKAGQDFGTEFSPWLAFAATWAWEFGGEIKMPSGDFSQAPMVTRVPAATEEDVRNLKCPDPARAEYMRIEKEFYDISSQERLDNEYFNVKFLAGGPFTRGANVCSLENMCRWMLKKPDVAHHMLRLSTDFCIARAEYFKEKFGVEGVLPAIAEPSASNQVISDKQFEEYVLPYLKETHEKFLSMGFKHIMAHVCGEHNRNLPHWAKIPFGDPGIISMPHEIDLEKAGEYFPNDIIIGNIEPAIIQTRSPEEVYEATRKIVEKGKKLPGGFGFSPGCELPPRSPLENVKAMCKAVEDFGWY